MDALDGFIDSLLSATEPNQPFAVGTVATVSPTTVTWNGATVTPRVPLDYTPVIGHTVLMARLGPQLLILRAY